ncbi:MAG TPA: 50S ribosomal protein L25 [Trueperaceae bacterium]
MKLSAQKRDGQDARSLRRAGQLPGIMYNKQVNVPVSMDRREFDKVFRSQGTSHVIDLDIDGKSHEVLVKAVQMHKRRREPQHVDFYAVTAGQEVDVYVHLDFVGTPVGVREGGQLDVQRREVQIRILPRHIPEKVEVDVTGLEINHSIHVADVVALLPKQATLLTDPELTVITVLPPKLVEEEETVAAEEAEAEPEVIGRDEDEEEEAEE